MKVKYLLPVLAFIACVTPDPIQPIYTFEVWQCNDTNDLKICYSVDVPEPGYTIYVAGDDYAYNVPAGNKGCIRSTLSVLEGDVWVTLEANGIKDTKHLIVGD